MNLSTLQDKDLEKLRRAVRSEIQRRAIKEAKAAKVRDRACMLELRRSGLIEQLLDLRRVLIARKEVTLVINSDSYLLEIHGDDQLSVALANARLDVTDVPGGRDAAQTLRDQAMRIIRKMQRIAKKHKVSSDFASELEVCIADLDAERESRAQE